MKKMPVRRAVRARPSGKETLADEPQLETLVTILPKRSLSEFERFLDPSKLLASAGDGIFVKPTAEVSRSMEDIGSDAYVIALTDASVIPAGFFVNPDETNTDEKRRADHMHSIIRERDGHILLTSRQEVIATSFLRDKARPPTVVFDRAGRYQVGLPTKFEQVDEPCVFIELVAAHFGHMIVDVPGRLWPFGEFWADLLGNCRLVGLPKNRIRKHEPLSLPSYIKTMFRAFGVDPEKVELIHRPTIFKKLIVPSRIAPFAGKGGAIYNRLAQTAGDRLIEGTQDTMLASDRVFLSRSRLVDGINRVIGLDEAVLDAFFAARGYTVFHPQEHSLAIQVHVIRSARIVAGIVGSQMHLAAFSRRKGMTMLELRPRNRTHNTNEHILAGISGTVVHFDLDFDLPEGWENRTSRMILDESALIKLDKVVQNLSRS